MDTDRDPLEGDARMETALWPGLTTLEIPLKRDVLPLRQHRLLAGFTIEELAKEAKVSTQTIVKIEKGGEPYARLQSYRKIADALKIELTQMTEFLEFVRSSDK